jgi:transposase
MRTVHSDVRFRATGRPWYHPAVLLKLYIYGYLNRVQSSRRLEREAGRNVEVMWLTGRLFLTTRRLPTSAKTVDQRSGRSARNLWNYAGWWGC